MFSIFPKYVARLIQRDANLLTQLITKRLFDKGNALKFFS
jgi:hypothetical protein